jgi:eukaryotic-like serine/threonine-protein kinase
MGYRSRWFHHVRPAVPSLDDFGCLPVRSFPGGQSDRQLLPRRDPDMTRPSVPPRRPDQGVTFDGTFSEDESSSVPIATEPLPPGAEVSWAEPPLEQQGRYVPVDEEGRPSTVPFEIGRGGVGRVILVEDRLLGRLVAKKELQVDKPARVARFLREARLTSKLEHPGIVPVYELGRGSNGDLYYTMKKIHGRTLSAVIAASRGLEERLRLLDAFLDICLAVAFAHDRGIVHLDIKPKNIMIGQYGEAVLLDWGIAESSGEPPSEMQGDPRPGQPVLGTPSYMSPEQALGDRQTVGVSSDVWALGAVLYDILTGHPPFVGASAEAVLDRVATERVPPVLSVLGTVPVELAAITERALMRRPGERYATVSELAEEVRAWRDGRPVGAYTYRIWELARLYLRRHRGAVFTASVATVILLLFALVAATRILAERHRDLGHLAASYADHAAAALLDANPFTAGLYAASALGFQEGPEARGIALALSADLVPWQACGTRLHERLNELVATVDGKTLFAGTDHGVMVIDAATCESRVLSPELSFDAESLAVSPDGAWLAVGNDRGMIFQWDLVRNVLEGRLFQLPGVAWEAALVLPSGDTLAASGGGRLYCLGIRDDEPRKPVWELVGRPPLKPALSLDPSGTVMTWGTSDGVFERVTVRGERLPGGGRQSGGLAAAWSPDGKVLATAGSLLGGDTSILLSDPSGGVPQTVLDAECSTVDALAFAPDGRTLAAGDVLGHVHFWDLASLRELEVDPVAEGAVRSLIWQPGLFVTAGAGGNIRRWRLPDRHAKSALIGEGWVTPFGLLDETHLVVGTNWGHSLAVWDLATDTWSATLPLQEAYGRAAALPGGSEVVFSTMDGRLERWDTKSGAVGEIAHLPLPVVALAVPPDGGDAWVVLENGAIEVFDLGGLPPHAVAGSAIGATDLAFTHDGARVAIASNELVQVRSVYTGSLVATIDHSEGARSLDWSDDGSELAVGFKDGAISRYLTANWRARAGFGGHDGLVTSLHYLLNDRLLLSTGEDRRASLWDLRSGKEIARLEGHADMVWWGDAADGRLVTVGSDGMLRRWDLAGLSVSASELLEEVREASSLDLEGGRPALH